MSKCGDLWHIRIVKNVESFWDYVHMSALSKWGGVRVSHKWSFDIKFLIPKFRIFLKQGVSVSGHILSSVALSCHIKVTPLKLWVLFEEVNKEINKLIWRLVHVSVDWLAVGETSSDRLIYENEMHDLIPGAFRIQVDLVIVGACACSLDPERSVKKEVGEHRAGSRAAVHIDHKGRVSIVICVHPVEHLMTIVFVCWQCAWIHAGEILIGSKVWKRLNKVVIWSEGALSSASVSSQTGHRKFSKHMLTR
jgi:hypothetical protein